MDILPASIQFWSAVRKGKINSLTMKVIVLVRFVLKLVGALPALAHNKAYRFYSFFILFFMTANLYAYVISQNSHEHLTSFYHYLSQLSDSCIHHKSEKCVIISANTCNVDGGIFGRR